MKKLNLAYALLALFTTPAFAQESTEYVNIPKITIQCRADELPCSEGKAAYSYAQDPIYFLVAVISTRPHCDLHALNSHGSSMIGFSGGYLSQDPAVYQDSTYSITPLVFNDDRREEVSSVEDREYTLCSAYGHFDGLTLTYTYAREDHRSFKDVKEIVLDSKGWKAL